MSMIGRRFLLSSYNLVKSNLNSKVTLTSQQLLVRCNTFKSRQFIVNFSQACAHSATPNYWDYSEEFGPSNWTKIWKTDKRQSPIDILTNLSRYDPSLSQYNIDDTPVLLNVKNFGLNVTTTPIDQEEILLTGGALKHVYQFREFHFHWGNVNTCGCEHTLNGHRFAAELHIVHWNRDLFKNEGDAISGEDGLAVLGVFLEAKESYESNVYLDTLLNMFKKVPYNNDSYDAINGFTPYSLLPENKNEYFTYPGSLTTPPLTENVTWTVFREPLKISISQLEEFNKLIAVSVKETKALKDKHVPKITNNYRPTQPLFDRVVYASFKTDN